MAETDHPDRTFQLAQMCGLPEQRALCAQTIQRDRLSPGGTWRGLPAAGRANQLPHAWEDRPAIR